MSRWKHCPSCGWTTTKGEIVGKEWGDEDWHDDPSKEPPKGGCPKKAAEGAALLALFIWRMWR